MGKSNITSLTLIETIESLKKKEFSKEELNEAYLQRIEQLNPSLNAYLLVNEKVTGIPAAIKDVIVTKDMITTASSKILEKFIPPYDATVMKKLFEQGIGIIGKTNCDEFAMGSSNENSAYGIVRNPWDLERVPGGSSGGSAVAVSSDLCVFALGSDTGGSIRQPASLSSVVGLKPSYGRISRYGLMAMASSLDQIGPFTKTVGDTRLVLDWISGADGRDSNCMDFRFRGNDKGTSLRGVIATRQSLNGLKIGVPREYFGKGLDQGVEKVIKEAIKKLEDLGAEIVEVSLPHSEYAVAAYYILMSSEVSSNLARFTGIRFGSGRSDFGPEVKRRIMLGTFSLSTGYYDDYFAQAAKVRTLIKQDFEKAFDPAAAGVDVIVGPVSPTPAWSLGDKISDPLTMYLSDVYTIPTNLAGIPGLSIPCGFSDGLPVGLHIQGKYMDEETLLDVGEVYEQATDWHKQRPVLSIKY